MSNDIEFINGLNFKAPNEGAPEFVLAKGSIKRLDLIAWLTDREGDWVNFDLKESKGGKLYAAVDNWKPNGGSSERQERPSRAPAPTPAPAGGDLYPDDDIPF